MKKIILIGLCVICAILGIFCLIYFLNTDKVEESKFNVTSFYQKANESCGNGKLGLRMEGYKKYTPFWLPICESNSCDLDKTISFQDAEAIKIFLDCKDSEMILEEGLLSSVPKLQSVTMERGTVRLKKKFSNGAKSLNSLKLRINMNNEIDREIFLEVEKLKSLHIYDSHFEELDPTKFFVLNSYLEELILNDNNIKEIMPKAFSDAKNLHTLNLKSNKIDKLDSSMLIRLDNLKNLDISYNKLTKIEGDIFKYTPKITDINLENNNINEIESKAFQGLNDLKVLNLQSNNLAVLEIGTFSGLHLTSLNLNFNKIKDIPIGFFKGAEIHVIHLGGNALNTLKTGVFDDLPKLSVLDLSSNSIKAIPKNFFNKLLQLKEVDLRANILTTIEDGIFSGLNLNSLNLQQNYLLEDIQIGAFKNCKIELLTLPGSIFSILKNGTFHGSNISKLSIYHRGESETIFNIGIYDGLFDTLIYIGIDLTDINIVPENFFPHFKNIKIINLSNNKITNISKRAFEGMNIESLDLRFNKLEKIEPGYFKNFTTKDLFV